MRAPAWTPGEVDASIALYLSMRVLEARGAPYIKAQLLRESMGVPTPASPTGNPDAILYNRTKGSVEAKLMNVTACLEDLERHDLSMSEHGYRPLSNYQSALKHRVKELVEGQTLETLSDVMMRVSANVA